MTMDPQSPGQNGARPDDEIHLRDVWNLLMRNWWVIGLSLVLVLGATVAYTLWQVPVYESVTSIRIDEDQQANLPVLDVLQSLSSGSEVETEMEVVRSRTLAEDVVDSLGLQVRLERPRGVARTILLEDIFVERWAPEGLYTLERQADGTFQAFDEEGTSLGAVSTTERAALPGATFVLEEAASEHAQIVVEVVPFDRAVAGLREMVSVSRPNREASIITVRYESADTQLVHRVPNTLARRFIDRGQAIRKTEATSTVAFLEEQIDTLSRQLAVAEENLTTFRETEQVVSIAAEAESQVTQLSNLQAERNTLETERSALQELVNEIEQEAATADPSAPSPYSKLISFPSLLRNQAISELLRNLNEANAQRSDLLRRRTMQDPDVVALTQRIDDVETQLRETALTYLRGLTQQVESYDETLARFGTELEAIPAKEVQLARLQRQTDVLEEVYTVLQNRLQEARILEAVEDPTVRVVDPANLPAEPIKPRGLLNVLLGLVLGGMLGVGIAFTREYMDDTVHTREDIQLNTGGAPVLGMIPRIRQATNGRAPAQSGGLAERLVAGRDPRNPVSEAYRSLRTNLTFSNPDNPPRTLVFTSALPQDGKSTSASNLSITLAQQGTKTILIDADLRRGILHNVFGKQREPGLVDVLTGKHTLGEAIQEVDLGESGTLWFLASGPYPPNPAEILGSERMRQLLEALEEKFEIVVLDTAPLTVVTDAAVLGTKADGVVLVARANQTEKGALNYAREQLGNVRAPILGAVLNDVDFRRDSRYYSSYGKYGYYYHYYYADNEKRRKKEEAKAAKAAGNGKG